jgi:hypothetical protein
MRNSQARSLDAGRDCWRHADLSHRADLRLRHPGEPKINRACGFQDDSPGSPDRRRKPQKWLDSALAPTR